MSLTPSFIGVQPATFTDASGAAVRPLGDIERDAFALMNWLDADQQRAASLAKRPADVVLGPGEDGKTIAPAGLPAARMSKTSARRSCGSSGTTPDSRQSEDAAERMSDPRGARGPDLLRLERSDDVGRRRLFPRDGTGGRDRVLGAGGGSRWRRAIAEPRHGIYRDPTNDYAARFVR